MPDTDQKRSLVHAWVDKASDAEVDELYQSLVEEEQVEYHSKLTEELDRRRAKHLSGESGSYTIDEMKQELENLRKQKARV